MLRIIQISDLHLDRNTDLESCMKVVDKFCETIKSKVNTDDSLIMCICGDILNQGDEHGFLIADDIFERIKKKLENYKISFEFTPGNHELDLEKQSFEKFDDFIKKYTEVDYSYSEKNVVNRVYEELNLLLVNSAFHKDHKYGAVDLTQITNELSAIDGNIILMMHHTMLSEYDEDKSSIRNAYRFLKALEEKNVIGLLHGHTHGYSDIEISNDCRVIGVGPFLKKQHDINLQFNMINLVGNKIDEVYNFRYSEDICGYSDNLVYKRKDMNYFRGDELHYLYSDILKSTKEYGAINNFNMSLYTSVSNFLESVETMFENDIEIAKDWQLEESPASLYYNHGEYMHTKDKNSIKYIIDELKGKATSSRAIIPLLKLDDVLKGGDSFLPSLDIIQFGFMSEEKTELSMTVYMRALEVKNFLKINICEIYLLIKEITDEIRSINKVNINIIAFRAQYKENFSCFRKADIDMLESYDIMMYTMLKDVSKIISLLENKLGLSETIIHLGGLEHLYNSILRDKEDFYKEDLRDSLKILIDSMKDMKDLRERTSDYESIKQEEEKVECSMKKVISKFKEIELKKNI